MGTKIFRKVYRVPLFNRLMAALQMTSMHLYVSVCCHDQVDAAARNIRSRGGEWLRLPDEPSRSSKLYTTIPPDEARVWFADSGRVAGDVTSAVDVYGIRQLRLSPRFIDVLLSSAKELDLVLFRCIFTPVSTPFRETFPPWGNTPPKSCQKVKRRKKPSVMPSWATGKETFVGWFRFPDGEKLELTPHRFPDGEKLELTSHWYGLVEATIEADVWCRLKARTAQLGPVDLAVLPEGKRPRIRRDRKMGQEYLLWRSKKDRIGGGSSDQPRKS